MTVKDKGFRGDSGPGNNNAFASTTATTDPTINWKIPGPRRHIQESMGSQLRIIPSDKDTHTSNPAARPTERIVSSRAAGQDSFWDQASTYGAWAEPARPVNMGPSNFWAQVSRYGAAL